MPTYTYECKKCGNIDEQFHAINQTPSVFCSICQSPCERIFSASGNFVLKGNDFPSKNFKMKKQMNAKSEKMKTKMNDRKMSGEGVTSLSNSKN